MKNNKLLYTSCIIAASMSLFQGCSEDESAPSGDSGVSFLRTSTNYFETDGDGTVEIPVEASAGVGFAYDGSATLDADYEVVGFSNGILTLNILDDDAAEVIEEIRIQIVEADGGVGNNNFHTVKIVSDDPGFLEIDLIWTDPVDLDLISWYFDPEDNEWHDLDFSDPGNTLDPIDWTDPDGIYGFTYNYYAGSDNSVDFSSVFTPTGVTLEGGTDPLTFNATYTLANVDPNNVQIEQICEKEGAAFFDFTEIEVPTTGSRRAELLLKLREAVAKYHKERGN